MSKFTVYTAAFYGGSDIPYKCLQGSCEQLGIPFTSYGSGGFPGYVNAKLRRNLEFLKEREEEMVLYCDADTFFLRDSQAILEGYESYSSPPMLFSAEKSCYPHWLREIVDKYPEAPTPWRFINSGHILADRKYMIDRIEWMLREYEKRDFSDSDQSYWSMAMIEGELCAKIDHHCRLFQTLSDNSADTVFQLEDGRYFNQFTATYPCAVHFNGRMKGIEDAYANRFRTKAG